MMIVTKEKAIMSRYGTSIDNWMTGASALPFGVIFHSKVALLNVHFAASTGPRMALNGRKSYQFETRDFYINTFFLDGKVSRIVLHKKTGYIDKSTISALLAYGAPNPSWGQAYQDPDRNWRWINNSKNLFASFVDNWTTVVLWTKADRDAIRAALRG
jgi:hypothetical protein